jgi:hypothetical protein
MRGADRGVVVESVVPTPKGAFNTSFVQAAR